MKYESEYEAMRQHSYYLRTSFVLASNRHERMFEILGTLGFAEIPTDDEGWALFHEEAVKEIGGIKTKIPGDARQEALNHYFGPLQIALCLLYAILEKYKKLSKANKMFQYGDIDKFCLKNAQFVQRLKGFRNSILHQRYDNIEEQVAFVKFLRDTNKDCVVILREVEKVYKNYLGHLECSLQESR